MPLFDSVTRLKAYLLERCTEQLRPAADCNFTFGYIGEGNKKFSITSEVQLAEALSLVKKGMIICGSIHTYLKRFHFVPILHCKVCKNYVHQYFLKLFL